MNISQNGDLSEERKYGSNFPGGSLIGGNFPGGNVPRTIGISIRMRILV